jgi:hypothetical protein
MLDAADLALHVELRRLEPLASGMPCNELATYITVYSHRMPSSAPETPNRAHDRPLSRWSFSGTDWRLRRQLHYFGLETFMGALPEGSRVDGMRRAYVHPLPAAGGGRPWNVLSLFTHEISV